MPSSTEITHISTDSREALDGFSLFLALTGERFDGHEYIHAAYKKGVRVFVLGRDRAFDCSAYAGAVFFPVADTLSALGLLARFYRRRFPIPFVGITGSAGKTTTKELTALFLRTKYTVLKNEGNFNNEIGVPKTLFNLSDEHEIAVIEMGMNHAGELARIAATVGIETALVTNVAPVHIEFFDSVSDIARAKAEIFSALEGKKRAFVNADNEYVHLLEEEAKSYGALSIEKFSANDFTIQGENAFLYKDVLFEHYLPGAFNRENIRAALLVAETYGADVGACASALKMFRPSSKRMEELSMRGALVINDTYNSNPQALKAMLTYLNSIPRTERIAVIGDMLELGKESERLHRDIADFIDTLDIRAVYTIGAYAHEISAGIRSGIEARHFASKEELADALYTKLDRQTAVLLKASRGIRLETVVEVLNKKESEG